MTPTVCLAVIFTFNALPSGPFPPGHHDLASLDPRGHWHVEPNTTAEMAWTAQHGDGLQRCLASGLQSGVVPIAPGPPDTTCGDPKVDLQSVIRADPLMRLCQPEPVIRCDPGQACS